jgi:hypothetical protein
MNSEKGTHQLSLFTPKMKKSPNTVKPETPYKPMKTKALKTFFARFPFL